jgi:hypothetical protein
MDPEEFQRKRAEYLNRLILKNPVLNLLQNHPKDQYPYFIQLFESLLQQRDEQGKLILPNLSAFTNNSLGIFSDYSGEGAGSSNYLTYSVLVCGYGYTSVFHDKMAQIRKKFQLGETEIAFKEFRRGKLRAALPDYLVAANELPGFLCTVAVDRRIATLFGPHNDRTVFRRLKEGFLSEGLGDWDLAVVEKLMRVVHMAAYLAALLAADGQKIFWMSDHDSICPNEGKHGSMMAIFDRVLRIYTRPGVDYPLIGSARPFDPPSIEMNDLLSLADVVAGSVAQYLTKSDTESPEELVVKNGAERVFLFLGTEGIGLRKATFVIRLNNNSEVVAGPMEMVARIPASHPMSERQPMKPISPPTAE